jgi:DNA polymerase II large subunit
MDYEAYIARLEAECAEAYAIVEQAKAKGLDPRLSVEIPLASDLADRTQKLLDFLHPRNTAAQIRELTQENDGNREMVAIQIARIVAAESLIYGENQKCPACKGSGKNAQVSWKEVPCENCEGTGKVIGFDSEVVSKADWRDTLQQYKTEALRGSMAIGTSRMATCMYHGICAGLAVLTEGILVAPLDGVVSCRIITNADGSESLAVNYAGPIRSAGGTGQALSVLIADVLRRDFGLSPPQVTFNEVERYKEEVSKYSRGLQYRPSNPQLEVIAGNCPVYVDGEGVGGEVTGQRDLERVPTNKVREGMLLVMCEGLVLKAPKILKYVEALEMDGWDWLKDFVKTGGKSKTIEPSEKYMADVLAGRPIFGLPMKVGGLRLRYGRSRLAGLATTAMHPVSMMAIGGFVICGTQMKYERPGKATVATPCDTIQGPYLQFKDGSGKRINSESEMKLRAGLLETDEWSVLPTEPDWPIEKVWDIGELLVPVGEFLENNHPLPPSPYVPEWHEQVVQEAGLKPAESFEEAWRMSETYKVPLDARYVPVGIDDVMMSEIGPMLASMALTLGNSVPLEYRELIYRLNVDIDSEGVLLGAEAGLILKVLEKVSRWGGDKLNTLNTLDQKSVREWITETFGVQVRPRTTLRIGARMGKPEGSKHREMNPSTHGIWPVGSNVGTKRLISDAVRKTEKYYTGIRVCPECNEQTWRGVCSGSDTQLHEPTETNFVGMVKQTLDADELWKQAMETTHQAVEPKVKGNKSLGSGEKIPEHLLKAVLRQRNGTSAFRDGTIRFDMVDITMTHFRPDEIGITAERARELGYDGIDASRCSSSRKLRNSVAGGDAFYR